MLYHLQLWALFVGLEMTTILPYLLVSLLGIIVYYGTRSRFRDVRSLVETEQLLNDSLNHRLFGQHMAVPLIYNAVINHIKDPNPTKALSMSFHGITGVGKNYAATFVAQALFHQGIRSPNVHLLSGNIKFFNEAEVHAYKLTLPHWIRGNLTKCGRSLFIFDEVDKLPVGVVDSIKKFLEPSDQSDDVDPRHAIFLFLSNAGAEEITNYAMKLHVANKLRTSIKIIDMERIVQQNAFNQKDGGFRNSELVARQIIDFYVPFLPLTRSHVQSCIKEHTSRHEIKLTPYQEEEIADLLSYFPETNPIYATSGCRQVEKKIEMYLIQNRI